MPASTMSSSADIYRLAFHASSIPMAISTIAEGRYIDINRAGTQALGVSREELIGRTSLEIGIYSDPTVRETIRTRVLEGNTNSAHDLEIRRVDGRNINTLMYYDVLNDGDVRWLTSGIDVTHLKEVEAALRETALRFRTYVENANDIIYELTPTGVFTYVSPNWSVLLGHDTSEVVGRAFDEFVHPDDLPACHLFLAQIYRDGKSDKSVTYRVLHKDGLWRLHCSNASLIASSDERNFSYIGIGRDISEQTRLRLELEMLNITSHREEERLAIARDLHDDLSQELTGLHIELASLSRTAADPDMRHRLSFLKDGLGQTIASVRGILAELRSDILDEMGLEGAVCWLAQTLRQKKGITCHIAVTLGTFEPSPMVAIAAYRIIQEALNNVGRHSRATVVRVSLQGTAELLKISVTDNGVGITDNLDETTLHYGIAGMKERARLCSGTLEVHRPKKGGTVLIATLRKENQ